MLRGIILGILIIGTFGASLNFPPFPDSQIVGGTLVDIREHPHQLSLQTSSHVCGASIIDSQWAITAAHCVTRYPAKQYRLRAGNSNNNKGTLYGIKRIVRHPKYDAETIDYDIALLEIDGKIAFTKTSQPVKIAEKELASGNLVNVTGWGSTKLGGPITPDLMKISVPIVARKRCKQLYELTHEITERMICAGYVGKGEKDSCQGDSGGPLTAGGTLYGIVSWGAGCADPLFPGVYTNVALLRSWIKQNSGV